jgi:hypothetical protein
MIKKERQMNRRKDHFGTLLDSAVRNLKIRIDATVTGQDVLEIPRKRYRAPAPPAWNELAPATSLSLFSRTDGEMN